MKRYYEGEVSVFKREGSPYWTAYYSNGAGRQRGKLLKTKNLKAAAHEHKGDIEKAEPLIC